jgi:TnpA family transposase
MFELQRRAEVIPELGALGLVVNIIMLWSTIYIDAVLAQLRQEGYPVRDEDVARLSPFFH